MKKCRNGHVLDFENLAYSSTGKRRCKACERDRARKRRKGGPEVGAARVKNRERQQRFFAAAHNNVSGNARAGASSSIKTVSACTAQRWERYLAQHADLPKACSQGHAWEQWNLYLIEKGKRVYAQCRICRTHQVRDSRRLKRTPIDLFSVVTYAPEPVPEPEYKKAQIKGEKEVERQRIAQAMRYWSA